MFQSHENLQQGQIASYFSRLAIMAKVPASKRQTIDEVKVQGHQPWYASHCLAVMYTACLISKPISSDKKQ